ncbi:MAG: peptidoglycan DD-metalloendopeptidase family protein [Muribaculaceae bacterium]|nr:peptidoglycan DD-metalloendopeptidase family protein [Muribaculaceae bacterium]
MNLSQNIRNAGAAAVLAILGCSAALAQNYQLPGQHRQQHGDLLANQGNTAAQVDNTTKYLETLFSEEEEPEFDIYTEGWESQHVNCYAGVAVPETADIDVSRFSMPVPGYITSPYGYRRRFRRMHKGVDLKVNIGDTVRAAFDGRVRITNFERRGYGYYVVLRHTNDLETVYGHLSKFLVEPDQYVKAGQPIALGGNTGRSTGPHLHFETRYMGYAINPCAIFDFANQTTHTDVYTFDKRTYQNARNFSPKANEEYAQAYRAKYPNKPAPASSAGTSGSGSKTYTVRKGDTLGRIAARNGTKVATICKLNGITAKSTLRPGQKLRLR